MPTARISSFEPDANIGIIGAGAAGLTAARALKQKGFRSVTVLEREQRVGGKCFSFIHEGRVYDLGAFIFSRRYENFHRLLAELGIQHARPMPIDPAVFLDPDTGRTSLVHPLLRRTSPFRMGEGILRFRAELMRRRDIHTPGLTAMQPDTFVSFAQWGREANVGSEAAQLMAELLVTSVGYGYWTEIPALYALKCIDVMGVPAFFSTFDDGWQKVWEAVARGLDIRRGINIQRVRRDGPVVVETSGESFSFDALIVTSPFSEAPSFLDATEEERELASKVRYQDIRVVIASATGLPKRRCIGMVPKYYEPSARGELSTWYKPWADRDIGVFYAYGREGTSMDETISQMANTMYRAGSSLTKIHQTMKWSYFPHVGSQDLALGFYHRLEAMQGVNRTYYAGELLEFATVETVMRQARDLVDRHFHLARPPNKKDGSLLPHPPIIGKTLS